MFSVNDMRRLDDAVVAAGLAESRSRAKRLILAGQVRIDGAVADKPGSRVAASTTIEVDTPNRFVSRGGEKLAPALTASGIDVAGRTALDVGASTGGFTDCLLQAGARHVIAVDVGYGQLAWKLRQDERVSVLERTNARNLTADDLPNGSAPPAVLVMDVSFIGIGKILPAVTKLCATGCDALLLVKPQFEAGPEHVARGGVVRSAAVRRECVQRVADAASGLGWVPVRAIPSSLRGPAGNWECFLQLRLDDSTPPNDPFADLEVPDDMEHGSPHV